MKLKTRTNQPVYYKLPVSSNMQSLSDDLLNSLRVGDVVQKKTGNQKHCYIVTYKEEKKGICLTYTDASCVETISYDYTDGHWVYNSKDVQLLDPVQALRGKDVSVKTISQTQPNASVSISEAVVDLPTGLEFSITYGKFEEINNVAYLVLIFNFINNTDATITVGNSNYITFDIPEEIASRILDKNGVALNSAGASQVGISADYAFNDNTSNMFYTSKVVNVARNATGTKNKMTLQVRDASNVSAGKTHQYVFRTFFTLI